MRSELVLAIVAGAALSASPARAQAETADFLFGAPRGAFSLRAGFLAASASSDIHDFLQETFTLSAGDFNAPVVGIDVALALHSRIDVLFGFEFSKAGADSEYREFVEDDGSPITQRTELTSVPLSASIKLYLTPRGREISRFAFVPSKVRPYVGAGAGFIWHKLAQVGDFVDFVDLSIFSGSFESTGWGTETHAFGGFDLQLAPKWYASFEGRYLWAEDDLSGDFIGFDPIDLSGLRVTAGINVSF